MTSSSLHSRALRNANDCAAIRAAVHAWSPCASSDYLAIRLFSGTPASLRARLGVSLTKLRLKGLTRSLISGPFGGLDVLLFARQVVPDNMIRDALADNPETQVVLLGAGLDSSGLRISAERRKDGQEPGKFFEVDLSDMQAEKRQRVARLKRSRKQLTDDNIVYVPSAFDRYGLGNTLCNAGFDPQKPAICILSGVLHYLPEDSVRATIGELRRISSPGSKLFFDFILLEARQDPDKYKFDKLKSHFESYGAITSIGIRQGEGHLHNWLTTHGLRFVRTYTNDDMVDLYEKETGRRAPSRGTPWSALCIAAL